MNKKLNITRNSLLAVGLLLPLLLVGCKAASSGNQTLKNGEVLQLHFSQPVDGIRYLSATADEINWFRVEPDWFVLDYKHDPGTYYINNDYILTWGIER